MLYLKTQSAGTKTRINSAIISRQTPEIYPQANFDCFIVREYLFTTISNDSIFAHWYAVTRRMSSLIRAKIKLKPGTQLLLTGLLTQHDHRSLTRHVTTRNNRQTYRDSPKAPRRNTGQFEG